jgi:hypothetical protein
VGLDILVAHTFINHYGYIKYTCFRNRTEHEEDIVLRLISQDKGADIVKIWIGGQPICSSLNQNV